MLLGGFDGLHFGHKTLLSQAKKYGLPIGITTIIGGKSSEGVFTVEERRAIFKDAGVDFVFELPFVEIKNQTPSQFAQVLMDEFAPSRFICGEDFRFGKNAEGTPAWLKEHIQVCVEVQPLLEMDGEKVSSGKIKSLLLAGEIQKANRLLDGVFFLSGRVEEDRKVGRTIGFPTANIVYPKDKFPLKQAVYETRVVVDGVEYKGITNYGTRPTFSSDRVITETYLDGFDGNLYGKTLTVRFVRLLREIQKFDGISGLKAQLQEDIRRVREND